jgi:hypothetical protein
LKSGKNRPVAFSFWACCAGFLSGRLLLAVLPALELDHHRSSWLGHAQTRSELAHFLPPAQTYTSTFTLLGPDPTCIFACGRNRSTRSSSRAVKPMSRHARRDRLGFRVILATDALGSSADETHDAMMAVYLNRFGEQVECVTTETLLAEI